MTDKKILELLSKAVGIPGVYVENLPLQGEYRTGIWDDLLEVCWNPLLNNGDAFFLMVTMDINVHTQGDCVYNGGTIVAYNPVDIFSTVRREIVRAAVEAVRQLETSLKEKK